MDFAWGLPGTIAPSHHKKDPHTHPLATYRVLRESSKLGQRRRLVARFRDPFASESFQLCSQREPIFTVKGLFLFLFEVKGGFKLFDFSHKGELQQGAFGLLAGERVRFDSRRSFFPRSPRSLATANPPYCYGQ